MTYTPEFSHPLSVEGISPDKERIEKIKANDKECAALAKRFELRKLSDFEATIKVRRVAGGMVRLEGKISAEVVQTCVVSLQDVHAHVTGTFDTYLTEEQQDLPEDVDIFLDDPESAAEMIIGGNIDLGEVASQYLSLNLDPYPRAPGVSLAAQLAAVGAGGGANPFAVLKGLEGGKAAKPAAKAAAKPVVAAKKPVAVEKKTAAPAKKAVAKKPAAAPKKAAVADKKAKPVKKGKSK